MSKLDKEQVKEDLLLMAKSLCEAMEKIKEVYERMQEIYEIAKSGEEHTIEPKEKKK